MMKKTMTTFIFLFFIFCCFDVEATFKPIYHGSRDLNRIYLTFDDGFSAKNTTAILDILQAKNVKATFFIEGGFLMENPEIVKRIAKEQTLGNHTMRHVDITRLSLAELEKEILSFEEVVFKLTDTYPAKYFRPPMGKFNQKRLELLMELGYKVFLWDVSCYDYVYFDDKGVDYVLKTIFKQVKNGSVILLHTMTKSNVEALPHIIDNLQAKGYVFGELNEF